MRTSAPPAAYRPDGRLPVNPRRNHVKTDARKRVAQACNGCNVRRIRCSGEKPCSQCSSAGRTCDYPAPVEKVTILRSQLNDLQATKDSLERCLEQAIPDPVMRQSLIAQARHAVTPTGSSAAPMRDDEVQHTSPATSSSTPGMSPPGDSAQHLQYYQTQGIPSNTETAPTEGSLLQDRDGTKRWLGGTSGATFLDHLKKFMYTLKSSLGYNETPTGTSPGSWFLASRGQYQTSDSQLLCMPTPDNATILAQLTESHASYLLSKVNKYIQDCTGQWACGGIYYFGDFSLENWQAVRRDPSRQRELAFYQAAFALGTIYSLTAANSRQDGQLGEMFIARARDTLGDLLDISRYSIRDVPTLALMAMYMAEVNRRDNSYHYLSNAMNICCMFGGFKGLFNDERDVRIVWTLYCLTRDASCLMGRPPIFPDEAFQLAYPSPVDGLPPPYGLTAHIKLSRIAGCIVSNTYSIAPREGMTNAEDAVAQPLRMLDEWREGLEPRLQIPLDLPAEPQIPFEDTPNLGTPIGSTDNPVDTYADRALCTLHMKYNQLIILTLRPLFFLAVKSYIGGDLVRVPRDIFDHPHRDYILQCRDAARRNLRLGRHIFKRCNRGDDDPGKLTMPDLHHIFNAAVVLLLHHMVFIEFRTSDSDGIRFARHVFEKEAQTECLSGGAGAIATGYASDCLGVLKDLTALVARIRPIRFKGSHHVTTGVDDIGLNIGAGNVAIGEDAPVSVSVISDEDLQANLRMPNPFGTDISGLYSPFVMAGPLEGHTNGKELQRWMEEENLAGLNCPFGIWHVI